MQPPAPSGPLVNPDAPPGRALGAVLIADTKATGPRDDELVRPPRDEISLGLIFG